MTFADILRDLVISTEGAIAAIFMDREGEAVQIIGEDFLRDELKVIGAYHGIFLSDVQRICKTLGLGGVESFKIDWEGSTMLNRILPDGYYLVMVLCTGSNEARAWQELERCGERLRSEIAG
jgi:hypothetical protein